MFDQKRIPLRSHGYALCAVALVLVVGWAGRITWRELRQLHRSFDLVQEDAFQLSDHIEASVTVLNSILRRFNLDGHPEDRAAFQKQSQDLREWIRARQPGAVTAPERDLVGRLGAAFAGYASVSTRLTDERAKAGTEPAKTLSLEPVYVETRFILELSEKLRVAEHDAEARFLGDSRQALVWLQQLLAVQMGLLVFSGGTAALAMYRGVIGPLRAELVESRARGARQEKLASLGTLAAGVAHEIRNPLTAINVRLHSLKKNLAPNSSEKEDALVIGHEIMRLERIVQHFLRFARPTDPRIVAVSAGSLLARMESLFGPQFEKTSLRLRLETIPDVWVRVDPHQMEQVLINLIQNAAESMDAGGLITLRVRSARASPQGRDQSVVMLEVSDTGKGISPEAQQRMFDPFFTTKREGTGLGLAIAARIVEKHGGALECRSELNRGTTFAILLPRTQAEEFNESASEDSVD